MKRAKVKELFLVTAIVMVVFLFLLGTGYAATVSISGPSEVEGIFEFSVFIEDIGELVNLDGWGLGLAMTGPGNAEFVTATGDLDSRYVFFDNSDDFYVGVPDPIKIIMADDTANMEGEADVVGKLLATVTVDAGNKFCEEYTIDVIDDFRITYFIDTESVEEGVQSNQYGFHVVPIPGTLLLLGSGILGLIGLRKRSRRP